MENQLPIINDCKEYRVSIGWKVFGYLFLLLFSSVTVWTIYLEFFDGSTKNEVASFSNWLLPCILLILVCTAIYLVLSFQRLKFVIDTSSIWIVGAFAKQKRELSFSEINGFRTDKNGIWIEPKNPTKKKIQIGNYFGNGKEIIEWLSLYFPNLDKKDIEAEEQEILANEAFGETFDERKLKLVRAKKVTKILNRVSLMVGLWAVYYPRPYEIVMGILMILFVISIFAFKLFQGLIKLDSEGQKKTAYPILGSLIVIPLSLAFRTISDYQLFDYAHVWLPSICVGLTLLLIFLFRNKEINFKKVIGYFSVFGYFVIFSIFGYATVVPLNCLFDSSEPEIFKAKVLEKRISDTKVGNVYYLTITPWEKQKESDEVRVYRDVYKSVDKDSTVDIYMMQGRLRIPWIEIEKAE